MAMGTHIDEPRQALEQVSKALRLIELALASDQAMGVVSTTLEDLKREMIGASVRWNLSTKAREEIHEFETLLGDLLTLLSTHHRLTQEILADDQRVSGIVSPRGVH